MTQKVFKQNIVPVEVVNGEELDVEVTFGRDVVVELDGIWAVEAVLDDDVIDSSSGVDIEDGEELDDVAGDCMIVDEDEVGNGVDDVIGD